MKFAAILGFVAGVSYLSWRLVVTSQGIEPWIFWPLYCAELFGFLTFLMLIYEAWETPSTPRPASLSLKTDIVIATYNEEIDVLEPTIVGALTVRGDTQIWLCDDGRRPEVEALAKSYGINYQIREDNKNAKAGNINAVLPKLEGELVLILDADHVPSPDVLEAMSGYFTHRKVALVQSAHSFRNHNSVMHEETGRHEQSLFFDVLLPGRNRLESVFWCGSAALIRLSALRDVGGVATRTSTEDFETSLLLQIRGYKIRYHNEHLIQGLAPDNLPAYITQRARWAQGTLSAFRPGYALPLNPGLTLRQRTSYFGAFLYYITPLQRVTYTTYLVLVGLFGLIPVAQADLTFFVLWMSYVLLTVLAISALERGSTHPFEGVRNTFLSLEPFLRAMPVLFSKKTPSFKVTPKNEIDLGGVRALTYLRLPLLIISLNLIVISVRWIDYALLWFADNGFLPPLPLFASLAMTFFGLMEFFVISVLAKRLFDRRQYRKLWRFPVRVEAVAESTHFSVVDLHQRGMAIFAPRELVVDLMPFSFELSLTDIQGSPVSASGTFYPRNLRPLRSNPDFVRVGGTITWKSAADTARVIEYCYVLQPYQAKNRFWTRRSPRVQVVLRSEVAGSAATAIDLSVGGVAFQVRAAPIFEVGSQLAVKVWNGSEEIDGLFTVRSSKPSGENGQRVGGEVEWSSTGWLNEFVSVEHKAQRRSAALHAFLRR